MVRVPSLEEQGPINPAQYEFSPDHIQVLMHSQTNYDSMWKPHTELSPESYWLLAVFKELDKVKNLTDDQQVKLQEVIP